MYIIIFNLLIICGVGYQLLMFKKKICEVLRVLLFVKFFESRVEFVRYIDDVVNDVVVELIFYRSGYFCYRFIKFYYVYIFVQFIFFFFNMESVVFYSQSFVNMLIFIN